MPPFGRFSTKQPYQEEQKVPYDINGAPAGTVGTDTGWTADTGTASKAAHATYSGTASAAYVQAELQGAMDALRDATQTIKALKDALMAGKLPHA